MKKEIIGTIPSEDRDIVYRQINWNLLPDYMLAAHLLGIELREVATECQSYQSNRMLRKVYRDNVAISLRPPKDLDLKDFFEKIKSIRFKRHAFTTYLYRF